MTAWHIAVVGSGRLARSVCHSLAVDQARRGPSATPVRVTVLARDGLAAREIARHAATEAERPVHPDGAVGTVRFTGVRLVDPGTALAALHPDVLVCCASAHSPYERIVAPSAWTDLVEHAGFGVTLALQAAVVVRLARAAARVSPRTRLVNGCFPDAVNPVLAALGCPVDLGIGNVATLAACLQAALDRPDQRGLAVLAHHAHLLAPDPGSLPASSGLTSAGSGRGPAPRRRRSEATGEAGRLGRPAARASGASAKYPATGARREGGATPGPDAARGGAEGGGPARAEASVSNELLAWLDGTPLANVTALLARDRARPRAELNAIGGTAAARLLLDLATGTEIRTSLPGPLGLPGGYPVRLTADGVDLDLPAGVSRDAAVGWNTLAGRRDGIEVDGDRVVHLPGAAAALEPYLPDLAAGWPVDALDRVGDRLTAVRQRLRLAQPVPIRPAR